MKPAKRDIDPDAKSHEGQHGGFAVRWFDTKAYPNGGWWVICQGNKLPLGPFHTSQAAFGAAKDAIDQLLTEEVKNVL